MIWKGKCNSIAFSLLFEKFAKPICNSIKFNIAEAAKYGFVWKNAVGAMTRQNNQTKILFPNRRKKTLFFVIDFLNLHWGLKWGKNKKNVHMTPI